MNAINRITCRWDHGTWVFDDEPRGLHAEPFVAGAQDVITTVALASGVKDPVKSGVIITFAEIPFPTAEYSVTKINDDVAGAWYNFANAIKCWLCPATLRYFESMPDAIHFRIEAAS
jgi:hypothetical protein